MAFEKLSKLKVGALFMEMGTGKTRVALNLIASKVHKVDYILWICPYSLKHEIAAEQQKWHPDLPLDIVGCESIGSSDSIYLNVLQNMQNKRCFVVVDESLKIKNKDAKRTGRILKIGELAIYKLILNGTPLSKNVLDLWTQMQFLSPKILNMSYSEFKNTYCEYYIRGRLRGAVKKQCNVEHLVSLIQPYIFDCDLEINSKKNYHDITYSMSESELYEYESIKNEYLRACFNNIDGIDFFAFSQLLQKHYCAATSKQQQLKSLVDIIGEKVIVFVKFLNSIPDGALRITGDMDSKQRTEAIQFFRDNEKILYITYGCGAYGLNLQFAKNIIFAEHTFDYAQREQAEARVYRMGQKHDVDYYNLYCDIGLERLIRASLTKKTNLLDDLKREIERKGVEEWVKSI